jgi:xylan 1,4-beta-xylosidase
MDRREFLLTVPPVALVAAKAPAKETVITFDCARPGEPIRMLHGVNGGPLAAGGLLDLSARWKEAAFPIARLHDCHWPNPDVVDVHSIFPDAKADPAVAENYDFERTDEYLKAVIDSGASVVYRLGESIEHQKAKRRVRPAKDVEKWAAVCVGIMKHYTEGWAKGFKYPIRYWEIWNEPDNRPSCWTGTDEDYFKLYSTSAKLLKARFPKLKIGGPAFGNSGSLGKAGFEPTAFLKDFLTRCAKDSAPLDFFSWHCYTSDPAELAARAKAIRKLLDGAGFKSAESHLNEWNYLPDGSWDGMQAKDSAARQKWHDRINGAEGAAFVVASLIALQDAPVDVACYFTAEAPGMGLFGVHGVPSRAFAAFPAFNTLRGHKRLGATGDLELGLVGLAGIAEDKRSVTVLLSRAAGSRGTVAVKLASPPFPGPFHCAVWGADENLEWRKLENAQRDQCTCAVDLPTAAVRVIRFAKGTQMVPTEIAKAIGTIRL